MAGNRTIHATGDIKWNDGQIRILLSGEGGEVSKEIRRRATAVQKRAQRKAPVKTGQLKHSISVNTRYPSEGAVADITAWAPHAGIIEFGRGEVRPRRDSGWLMWEGDYVTIFAKSSPAVAGVHFMRDALDEEAGG